MVILTKAKFETMIIEINRRLNLIQEKNIRLAQKCESIKNECAKLRSEIHLLKEKEECLANSTEKTDGGGSDFPELVKKYLLGESDER